MAVRGFFGEGSQFMGDFYQVSNQVTLEEPKRNSCTRSMRLCRYYRLRAKGSRFLDQGEQQDLHDDVSRALGILCTAKKISSEETMHYLSKVRMGIHLGLIKEIELPTINKLFIHTQPLIFRSYRAKVGNIGSEY